MKNILIIMMSLFLLSSCKVQNMYIKQWCDKNSVTYPLSKDRTIKNKTEIRRWAFKKSQLYWDSVLQYESAKSYAEWKRNNTCSTCDHYNIYTPSTIPHIYYRSYMLKYIW